MFIPKPVSRLLYSAAVFCLFAVFTHVPATAAEPAEPFSGWLEKLRLEAVGQGISPEFLDLALTGLKPIKRVVELDRRQPEFTLTFWRYLNNAINDKRIRRGQEMLARHGKLLKKIEGKYGVPPRFIAAFWGLETNYGQYTGVFPVIGAVATLAHDGRRGSFFRSQLMAALKIMSRGDVNHRVKGSWAGAMGNFQFIPTTYKDFAVDGDGDGKRDMWNSYPDMFASAANYLSRSGWRRGWTWGREVRLPKGFKLELTGLGVRKPLSSWRALGVQRMDGKSLPDLAEEASIVLPAGYNGPAFLVYKNFRTILTWNRSILYAVAVGHLADRLVGAPPFKSKRPSVEVPLSRNDIKDMQRLLTARGFDTGGSDGVAGPQTRSAIRAYQKKSLLPADGYPNMGLLERLRIKTR
ncbi:MAG: lytic murein transglycosylase [Rhodospirillales bacterium]|nr:lytic murein transglycosylase [Alphaproteobacteria bacterium]MBL6948747.1 lytic murein transglycosylase [Rhodospirillales bacterium]